MTGVTFLLIFMGVMVNAVGQLLLKKGMNAFENIEFSRFLTSLGEIATNFYVIGGVACYILSMVIWLMVLTRVAVSLAYPMLSMGYIITAIAGYYLFQEQLTGLRILGILVIMVGVFLVSKSAT